MLKLNYSNICLFMKLIGKTTYQYIFDLFLNILILLHIYNKKILSVNYLY